MSVLSKDGNYGQLLAFLMGAVLLSYFILQFFSTAAPQFDPIEVYDSASGQDLREQWTEIFGQTTELMPNIQISTLPLPGHMDPDWLETLPDEIVFPTLVEVEWTDEGRPLLPEVPKLQDPQVDWQDYVTALTTVTLYLYNQLGLYISENEYQESTAALISPFNDVWTGEEEELFLQLHDHRNFIKSIIFKNIIPMSLAFEWPALISTAGAIEQLIFMYRSSPLGPLQGDHPNPN